MPKFLKPLSCATTKQGIGASAAAIGAGTILGWIAVIGLTGQNSQTLAATGLGLTLSGGALLTAGKIQEQRETRAFADEIWHLIND